MASLTARLACLVSGHRRVLAAMRRADGRFVPLAMCERCGAAIA
jgi:hypothetical protein